jgi:small subunit ribosomal protein S1
MSRKIKQRFVSSFIEPDEESSLRSSQFNTLFNSTQALISEGSVIIGMVVGIENEIVVIDVGLKNEGRIPISEFRLELNRPDPNIGDKVEIYVDKLEGINGKTILSRAKAIRERAWKELDKSFAENKFVNGTIFSRVKEGFAVDLAGVVAFLPGSQVDLRPVYNKSIDVLMHVSQPFKILKMDPHIGNIVVSRRAVLEEQRLEAKKDLLNNIVEGETVLEGVVKNITDYGAFVDLGSIDALLHITDISWKRVNHPLEALEIGQTIKVKVIKFDRESLRLHVGMKQLSESPWLQIALDFPHGKIFKGKVSNVTDYGAFVELRDGIEGLIHSSEISWSKNIQNPNKVLKIGQEVEFVIKDVNTENHKISLSIKRCRENPWLIFSQKHKVGEIITTSIRNVTDIGIFVALDSEIDGIIHLSDLSWEQYSPEALNKYSSNQKIECKILMIDVDKEQVRLGIKQLQEDPYDKLLSSPSLQCIITEVNDDFLVVKVNNQLKGIIRRNELSTDRIEQKTNRFSISQTVSAKPLNYDKSNEIIYLSIKALELEEQERAIKVYGSSIDSSINLGAAALSASRLKTGERNS